MRIVRCRLTLKEYKAGGLVVAPSELKIADADLYNRGEKPNAVIDYPVTATDYEVVDIFNWQDEAKGMLSQMEFIRRVDVQSETIERMVRDGKLLPDLTVPMSEHRTFKYFKEESLEVYAKQFGWTIISDDNRKELFLEMVEKMTMSYSYKPVLIKAVLKYADSKGQVKLADIVLYFRDFYNNRRENNLAAEKPNSIFATDDFTDKDCERNILSNPFKRFEDMNMMYHTKTLGVVEVDPSVWKKLSQDEKSKILQICDSKLATYYSKAW